MVSLPSVSLLCITVYRSPQSLSHDFSLCLQHICDIISKYPHAQLLLLGDLNCGDIDWSKSPPSYSTSHSRALLRLTSFLSLSQVVNKATRLLNTLDIVLLSHPQSLSSLNVLPPLLTCDHNVVIGTLSLTHPKSPINSFKDFSKANVEAINLHIANTDWQTLLTSSSNPDLLYSRFLDICHELIDKFVPLCTREQNTTSKYGIASFPPRINKLHRIRDSMLTNLSSYIPAQIKIVSEKLRKAIDSHRRNREKAVLKSKNVKHFFSFVNSHIKEKDTIPPILINNVSSTNDTDIANEFASHFSSSYNHTFYQLPTFSTQPSSTSLQYISFTPLEIEKALNALPSRNSTSPDNIPYSFLKSASQTICYPLSILFSQFLLHGHVPSIWKTSYVRPVYKRKGNKNVASSYRPISLTCSLFKLMERLIRPHIISFLNDINFFTDTQHGFRSKRSTTSGLISHIQKWHALLDAKSYVSVAFIDFTAAFDSVPLNLLLHKLSHIGIRGSLLRFISSLLTGRTQKVILNSTFSSSFSAPSGVPQGSVLGPLLFIMYINDIPSSLPPTVSCLFYADDCKIYSVDDPNSLQLALNYFLSWSSKWGLAISKTKTVVMQLGKYHPTFTFTYENTPLPLVTTFKDLGVSYSNTLSFESHITQLIKRCSLRANFILRSFRSRNVHFLYKLFSIYVRPVFDYADSVYSPHNMRHIKDLENVQDSFLRRAFLRGGMHPNKEERRRIVGTTSLENRRATSDLTLLHRIIHSNLEVSPSIVNRITSRYSNRRHNLLIECPRYRSFHHSNSFICRTAPKWNALPNSLVYFSNSKIFRKLIEKKEQ